MFVFRLTVKSTCVICGTFFMFALELPLHLNYFASDALPYWRLSLAEAASEQQECDIFQTNSGYLLSRHGSLLPSHQTVMTKLSIAVTERNTLAVINPLLISSVLLIQSQVICLSGLQS